jgi:tetratricopeptide (TPR) repeat protein
VPRHLAEWRLRAGGARLILLAAAHQLGPSAVQSLERVEALALEARKELPGDPRPLTLAAAAALAAGRAEVALGYYGAALALGERPEPLLNAGRVLARMGRGEPALAAFRRAGWVSPLVLDWLPAPVAAAVRADLAATEARLRAGDAGAVPPPAPVPPG